MKEQIVTGKKFRILADITSRLWHVISFWTKAQDVEFNDGTNAQAKLGNIVGISDSLTSTASNVAASAKAVKVLNDKVVNQIGNLNGQINNLNNQISQKNQVIDNLNNQLASFKDINNQLASFKDINARSFSVSGGAYGNHSALRADFNSFAEVHITSPSDFMRFSNIMLRQDRSSGKNTKCQMKINEQILVDQYEIKNIMINTIPNQAVTIHGFGSINIDTESWMSYFTDTHYDVFVNSKISSLYVTCGLHYNGTHNHLGAGIQACIAINNSDRKYSRARLYDIRSFIWGQNNNSNCPRLLINNEDKGELPMTYTPDAGLIYISNYDNTFDISGMNEFTISIQRDNNDDIENGNNDHHIDFRLELS